MLRFAAATDDAATYPAFALGDVLYFPADGKAGTIVGLPDDGAGGFVGVARVTWTIKARVGDADVDALAQRWTAPTVSGSVTGTAVFPALRVPASVSATFPATAGQPAGVFVDVQAELTNGDVRTLRGWAQTPLAQVTRAQVADVPASITTTLSSFTAQVGLSITVPFTVRDAIGNPVGPGHVWNARSFNTAVTLASTPTGFTDANGQGTAVFFVVGAGTAAGVISCEDAVLDLGGATGSAALTVPLPTLVAAGTASAPGTITGTAALTVPAPTLAATGTVANTSRTGNAALVVPAPTLAATGTAPSSYLFHHTFSGAAADNPAANTGEVALTSAAGVTVRRDGTGFGRTNATGGNTGFLRVWWPVTGGFNGRKLGMRLGVADFGGAIGAQVGWNFRLVDKDNLLELVGGTCKIRRWVAGGTTLFAWTDSPTGSGGTPIADRTMLDNDLFEIVSNAGGTLLTAYLNGSGTPYGYIDVTGFPNGSGVGIGAPDAYFPGNVAYDEISVV